MCYYFNPRSHEGSDFCAFCNSVMPFLFQSTLPRGERHSGEISEGNQSDFNPRSHEGSDNFYCPVHPIQCISIHAPTRGATIYGAVVGVRFGLFQSTLPRGERHLSQSKEYLSMQFQSTLPRGERPRST